MSLVDLNKNQAVARELETQASVANGIAIASGALNHLIGKDLGRSKEVSFDELIVLSIGNEVNDAIDRANAGREV